MSRNSLQNPSRRAFVTILASMLKELNRFSRHRARGSLSGVGCPDTQAGGFRAGSGVVGLI